MIKSFSVRRANLNNTADRAALARCLIEYSADPMGGGEALSTEIAEKSVQLMAEHAASVCFIAEDEGVAVGLANCFVTIATFSAKPAINIHDLAVSASHRRMGVGRALLRAVEGEARERGCVKITLEVLEGNQAARRAYEDAGFKPYVLDPKMGSALFLQKFLVS